MLELDQHTAPTSAGRDAMTIILWLATSRKRRQSRPQLADHVHSGRAGALVYLDAAGSVLTGLKRSDARSSPCMRRRHVSYSHWQRGSVSSCPSSRRIRLEMCCHGLTRDLGDVPEEAEALLDVDQAQ
ncbi:hypothetical protein ADK67_04885 [Saccharothrix sp. NRRL B-16348]|uniref:hypothetical protein n=1 Tax=Saccharothrix sp. NRRL B-16348 TaxID=1415542 RepID=UPI0006AE40C5|nr:hypothetical protein [Saccharothrix sp. NRRL B-16348]KOX33951.1 hypothetical protein ADK67_04885 [Saccharothrix sp. NRRL B-16348]